MTRSPSPSRLLLALLVVAALGAWQWWSRDEANDPAPQDTPTASPSAPSPGADPPRAPAPADRPSRDLSIDESRGGHTLARHVGLTDGALLDRLSREPAISAASTYIDRAIAEAVVGRALAHHADRVGTWRARQGNRPNLVLSYEGTPGQIIGRSVRRGRRDAVDCTDAVVVLRWDGRADFYVLTSYPEVRR